MTRSILTLLILLASTALHAETGGRFETGGRYVMEMIVFEQPDSQDEAVAGRTAEGTVTGALYRPGSGIQPLPAREGELGPVRFTLDRRGARVLAHLRWEHDFSAPDADGWMTLEGKGLEGRIRLRQGRFIHVQTDLLVADRPHPVRETGRLRSGELHYIDHPLVGILLLATRQPTETEAPANEDRSGEAPVRNRPPQRREDNPPEQREPAGEIPRALPDPT